jgi:AraC family transcriptional regulator, transcriptional activator of pobA
MNIPEYNEINELLTANNTGLKAELPYFHINRFEDSASNTGVNKKNAHRINFYSVIMLKNGLGSSTVNGKVNKYQSGVITFGYPGHVVSWRQKTIYHGYLLLFKPEFMDMGSYKSVSSEYPFFNIESNTLMILEEETQKFCELFEKILSEYSQKRPNYENIIKNYLHLLFSLSKRRFDENELSSSNFTSKKYQLMVSFDSMVRENMPERKPIGEYANRLFISQKHLIEIIKETTGKTPSDYVYNIFMNEARTYLLQTSLSISEIAYKLNYDDPSYFNKSFKRHFAMTPSEYRKVR